LGPTHVLSQTRRPTESSSSRSCSW
jgi:hypothetical protein